MDNSEKRKKELEKDNIRQILRDFYNETTHFVNGDEFIPHAGRDDTCDLCKIEKKFVTKTEEYYKKEIAMWKGEYDKMSSWFADLDKQLQSQKQEIKELKKYEQTPKITIKSRVIQDEINKQLQSQKKEYEKEIEEQSKAFNYAKEQLQIQKKKHKGEIDDWKYESLMLNKEICELTDKLERQKKEFREKVEKEKTYTYLDLEQWCNKLIELKTSIPYQDFGKIKWIRKDKLLKGLRG